jgi:hypothetical protein
MELYYTPVAFSLATHIAMIEAHLNFQTETVENDLKQTSLAAVVANLRRTAR